MLTKCLTYSLRSMLLDMSCQLEPTAGYGRTSVSEMYGSQQLLFLFIRCRISKSELSICYMVMLGVLPLRGSQDDVPLRV